MKKKRKLIKERLLAIVFLIVFQYNNGSPPQKYILLLLIFGVSATHSYKKLITSFDNSEFGFKLKVFLIGVWEQCLQDILQEGPSNKNTAFIIV